MEIEGNLETAIVEGSTLINVGITNFRKKYLENYYLNDYKERK